MPWTSIIDRREVILKIGESMIKNAFVFGNIEWIVIVYPRLYNVSLEKKKISKFVT